MKDVHSCRCHRSLVLLLLVSAIAAPSVTAELRWSRVPGVDLATVSVGPSGVWGLDKDGKVFYGKGTYNRPGNEGSDWADVFGEKHSILSCEVDGSVAILSCEVGGSVAILSCEVDGSVAMPSCEVDGSMAILSCEVDGSVAMPSCEVDGSMAIVLGRSL